MNCTRSLASIVLLAVPVAGHPIAHGSDVFQSFTQPFRTMQPASVAIRSPDLRPMGSFPAWAAPAMRIRLQLAASSRAKPRDEPPASSTGMSEEEIRLRTMLLQRSQGFGGIFAPLMQGMGQGGSKKSGNDCGPYTDYAACQAYKAGDGWAAERLQNRRSTPSEHDWYNR